MPNLSDKLKALGVKVGTENLPPPRPKNPYTIEQVLEGQSLETRQGETFVVESRFPPEYRLGLRAIATTSPLHAIARWAKSESIRDFPPQSFAYLDTETTGLSGGTGTYAFLIGVGRFDGQDFHLAQFFMRDPAEEPAQLAALEEFIAPCQALVTFNGKSFDVPLLNTRFIHHGWRSPFQETAHVDLLHLARRLWRDRLPSRSLGNLEVQILGAERTNEDVPGWMIPSLYFDYLRSGDARPLKSVFYHNQVDVVSMAALFNHMAGMLADPLSGMVEHGVDLIALAKLNEDMGELDAATRLYLHGLEHDLPRGILLEAFKRLALIYKRRGEFGMAIELWEQAARHEDLDAHVELAKYYEHQALDYVAAIRWTQAALQVIGTPGYSIFERRHLASELTHRLERLQRKMNS
jgi:uncharacterized protein YprB with RNaseH-like and TPR domain